MQGNNFLPFIDYFSSENLFITVVYLSGIRSRDTCIVVQPSESIGIICEVCRRCFDNKKSLKRHQKEIHRNAPTLKMGGRNKLGVTFGNTLKGNLSGDSQLGSSSDTGVVESVDASLKIAEKQKKFGSKAKGDKVTKLTQGDTEAATGKNNAKSLNDEARPGKAKAGTTKNEATKSDKKFKVTKLAKAHIKIVGRKGITISGKASSLSKVAHREKKNAVIEKGAGKNLNSTVKRPEGTAKVLMGRKILNNTMKLSKKAQALAERGGDGKGKEIFLKEQGNTKNHMISGKSKNVVEKGGKEQTASGKHSSKSTADLSLDKKRVPKIDEKLQKIIDEPFKCQECGLGFRNKTNLSKHTPIHLMMKYHCYRCNDVFLNMRSLTKHLALHEDEPLSNDHVYRCRICSQGFKTSRQLRRHMTDHERMEGLVDTLAPKKGSTKKDLSSPQVEKKFVDKISKDIDMKCGPCQQTFGNYCRFKEHVLNKHIALGDLSLQCSKCSEIFTSDVEVRRHLISTHKLNAREARATVRQKEADAVFLGLRASILEGPKEGEKAGSSEQTYGNLKSGLDTEGQDTSNSEASSSVQKTSKLLDVDRQSDAVSEDEFVENKPNVDAFNKRKENEITKGHSESVETDRSDKEFISATDNENKSCFLEEQESRNILQALFIEVDGELCETGPTEASSRGSNSSNVDEKEQDSLLQNSSSAVLKSKEMLVSSRPTLIQDEKKANLAGDIEVVIHAKEISANSIDGVEQKIQNQASDAKSYVASHHTDIVKKPSSADLHKPLPKHVTAPQPNEVSFSNNAIDVNFDREKKFKELIKRDIGDNVAAIIGLPDVCIDDDDDDDDIMWFWKNDESDNSTDTPHEIGMSRLGKQDSSVATSCKNLAGRTDGEGGETWLEDDLQIQGARSLHTDTTENCSNLKVSRRLESIENVARGTERKPKRDYRGRFSRIKPKTRRGRCSRSVPTAKKRGAVESFCTETVERNQPLPTSSIDDPTGLESDIGETSMLLNSNDESESHDCSVPQGQRSEHICVNDAESETMPNREESISCGIGIDASNIVATGNEQPESNIDPVETVLKQSFNCVPESLTSKSNQREVSSHSSLQGNGYGEMAKAACTAESYSASYGTYEAKVPGKINSIAAAQQPKADSGIIRKGNDNDPFLNGIVKDGGSEINVKKTEKDGEKLVCAFVNNSESVMELGSEYGGKFTDSVETNPEDHDECVELKAGIKAPRVGTTHGSTSESSMSFERMANVLEGPREDSLEYGDDKMNRDCKGLVCNNDQTATKNEVANFNSRTGSQKLTTGAAENGLKGNASGKSELIDSVLQTEETSGKIYAKEDADTRLGEDSGSMFCDPNGSTLGKESAKVKSLTVPREKVDVVENALKENTDDVSEHIESGVSEEERSGRTDKSSCILTELKEVEIGKAYGIGKTETRSDFNRSKLEAEQNSHELDTTEDFSIQDVILVSDFDRSVDDEVEETSLNEDDSEIKPSSHRCYSSSETAESNGMPKVTSVDPSETDLRKKRKFADTSMADQGAFLPFVRRKASISGEKRISESTRQRHSDSMSFTKLGSPNSKEVERHSLSEYDQMGDAEHTTLVREIVDSNIATMCETLTANNFDDECVSMSENLLKNDQGVSPAEVGSKVKSRKRGRPPSKRKMKCKRVLALQQYQNDRPNSQSTSVVEFTNKIGSAEGYPIDATIFSQGSDTGAVLTDNACSNILLADSELPTDIADEHVTTKSELPLPVNTLRDESPVCTSRDTLIHSDYAHENHALPNVSIGVSDASFKKSEQKRVKRSNVARKRAIDTSLIQEQGDLSSLIYVRRHAAVVGEEKIHDSAHRNKRHASTVVGVWGRSTADAKGGRPAIDFTDLESTNNRKKGKDSKPCFTHVATEDTKNVKKGRKGEPRFTHVVNKSTKKLMKGRDGVPCLTQIENEGQMDGFEIVSNRRGKSGYMPLHHKLDSKDHDRFLNINSRSNFKCKLCGKSFDRRSRLFRHLRKHDQDLPSVLKEPAAELKRDDQSGKLKCDLCSKTFNTAYYLSLHKKRHKEPDLDKSIEDEGSDELLFQCPVCKKSLSAKQSLTRHLKGHKEGTAKQKQLINNSLDRHIKKPGRPSKQKT